MSNKGIETEKDEIDVNSEDVFCSCNDPTSIASGNNPDFSVAMDRVREFFRTKNAPDLPTKLGLALAKYDYNDCPGNWDCLDQEEVIFEWAESCLEDYDRLENRIALVLDQYARGLIPDALELKKHFFG
jgi:hypothetical protein